MRVRSGWVAFLTLATVLSTISFSGLALASPGEPTFACFNPRNAELIGRLGPADAGVRHAFEIGACLAFAPGVPLVDVARDRGLWRLRAYGASPVLFAPEWGMGFVAEPIDDRQSRAFSIFLPVTRNLLRDGRTFQECYDAYEEFSKRWESYAQRWQDYQRWGGRPLRDSAMVTRIFLGETGPRLIAEGDSLRAEGARLDRRCRDVQAIEADPQFIAFMRTATGAI